MKKILSITLAITMLLSLAACDTRHTENSSNAALQSSSTQSSSEVPSNVPSSSEADSPSLPPAEDGQTTFAVPVFTEDKQTTENVLHLAFTTPEAWEITPTTATVDGNVILQWGRAYPASEAMRSSLAEQYAKADPAEQRALGEYPALFYWMQSEVSEGGMTSLKNELYYYIEIDGLLVEFVFSPLMGMGGISTQREELEACLATLHPVAAVG